MSIVVSESDTQPVSSSSFVFVKGSEDGKVIEFWEAEIPYPIQEAINRALLLGRHATNTGFPPGSQPSRSRRMLSRLIG